MMENKENLLKKTSMESMEDMHIFHGKKEVVTDYFYGSVS